MNQSPTLICLIGPPAVGKMTVGQELCRLTGFKLFHGHVIGDVLTQYFPFGTLPFERLGQAWRRMFFEEAAEAGLNLVTTVAWRFDVPADGDTIRSWLYPYDMKGHVFCVELQAPLKVRQVRNNTEHRRRHKNAYWVTEAYLEEIHTTYRYDSGNEFPLNFPHLRLETAHLPASEAANRIVERFSLPRLEIV